MTEDEYSSCAVKDIIDKYLYGENTDQVWTIIMSLFATYYETLKDKDTIKGAMIDIMEIVDSGDIETIRKKLED